MISFNKLNPRDTLNPALKLNSLSHNGALLDLIKDPNNLENPEDTITGR